MKFLKKFNQNFLINYSFLNLIIFFIKPELKNIYIEIGFGDGNLTKNIILKLCFYNLLLYFIEIDNYFFFKFKKIYNLNINNINVLNFNFFFFKKFFYYKFKLFIIGNIPYNISSVLIFYLINFVKNINIIYFMLEYNYLKKIINSKTIISVIINSFYKIKEIFFIKKYYFFPAPNVNSIFVSIKPLYLTLVKINDFYIFKKFLKNIKKNKIFNVYSNYFNNYIYIFFKFKKKFIKF